MRTRPSLPFLQSTEETVQARLLRDTLHDRADVPVEVNSAWMQVARRLPELHQQAGQAKSRFPFWLSGTSPRKTRMRRLPMVATLALIAVLLMGAGIATGVTPSLWENIFQAFSTVTHSKVPESQFQEIGQQQQSNGINITLKSIYAGSDRTIIGLGIQLSPNLVKDFMNPQLETFVFVVNGQKETLASRQASLCEFYFSYVRKDFSNQEYCLLQLSPMRVSASTKQLNVSWDFTNVMLQLRSSSGVILTIKYTGHWSFHFTAPFHRQNHDPGLPPAPGN